MCHHKIYFDIIPNETDSNGISKISWKMALNTIILIYLKLMFLTQYIFWKVKLLIFYRFMYIITDFSLENYIEAAGKTLDDLTESFKQKLYDDLGISSYLRDDQCNISSEEFTPHYQGWKSGLYFLMTLVFLVISEMISVIYLHKILHHTMRDGSLLKYFLKINMKWKYRCRSTGKQT